MPRVEIEAEAVSVLRDQRVSVTPTMRTAPVSGRLREIQTISAPTVTTKTTHDELVQLFAVQERFLLVRDIEPTFEDFVRCTSTRYRPANAKVSAGRKPDGGFTTKPATILEPATTLQGL